jgi:hypothetical protein
VVTATNPHGREFCFPRPVLFGRESKTVRNVCNLLQAWSFLLMGYDLASLCAQKVILKSETFLPKLFFVFDLMIHVT